MSFRRQVSQLFPEDKLVSSRRQVIQLVPEDKLVSSRRHVNHLVPENKLVSSRKQVSQLVPEDSQQTPIYTFQKQGIPPLLRQHNQSTKYADIKYFAAALDFTSFRRQVSQLVSSERRY